MVQPPIPDDEAKRLETLREYDVLDTLTEQPFERLVALTARVFDVPIAMISLIDESRQWAKARVGVGDFDGRRSVSFCGHAILSDQVTVVLDATTDERFVDNPLVTGQPQIRFYAGAPLIAPNGSRLGTLCILDQQPRRAFSIEDTANLSDLAAAAMDALELRRVNQRLTQAEEQLRREQSVLTETFAALEEGVVVQDAGGQIISANESAARVLGLSMDQLLGRTSFDPRWRAVREDGTPFAGEDHPVPVALRDGIPVSNVLMGVHHSDAQIAWISINARPLFRQGDAKPYAAVGSFRDVTEQYNKQTRLEFRAHHDSLTGLANRAGFDELLEQNRQAVFAVGYLDFNDFKIINDRFGHAAGDDLLRQAAQRLKAHLRPEDSVVRLGGDEFALYLPNVQTADQGIGVKKRIAAAFSAPFNLPGAGLVKISSEVGMAFYPRETRDFEALIRLADERMYQRKALSPRTPRATRP